MNSNNSLKILYLTYDGLTDHIGQSQILPYLLACSQQGIEIGIISFEKKEKTKEIDDLKKVLRQHGIEWQYLIFSRGGNFSKLKDFLSFVSKAFQFAKRDRFPIIHSRSYIASIVGLIIKIFQTRKLIFDKRDFWIDAKLETGRLDLSIYSHRVVHTLLRFFEKKLFQKSDHIISLTENAKNIILQNYPSRESGDITVIPCCVDIKLFNPKLIQQIKVFEMRKSLGLHKSFVLGYVGSVGPAYMIPQLLECFSILKKTIEDLKLLFLVNNDKEEVYKIVENKGLAREDVIVTSATRESMPLYIALFDAGIYFITPTFAKKATSPTKLAEMLAMNKPVITNKGVGDVEEIFKKLACGYLVDDFTEAEYNKAALWLKTSGMKCISADLDAYSLDYGAEKYFSVYNKLAG